jgi:NADH-quinone oxidoreductase subunit N
MNAGLAWLVIVGVVNSIIGLYYYLRVLKVMYLDEPEGEWKETPRPLGWAIGTGLCVIGVIILGVYLAPWFNWATLAAAGF